MEVWLNKMNENHKKIIRLGGELVFIGGILLALYFSFIAGVDYGQKELCNSQDLLLVENRGIRECMSEEMLLERTAQIEGGGFDYGLQYNFTG